jgi:hypothetical protein
MSKTFKPTHEITVPVALNNAWWETQSPCQNGPFPIIRADHPLVTVRELPRPIEAGDWVTITGWEHNPPGEPFEVLHVSDGRAWIRDAKGFNSLINIEDIERTPF